MSFFPLTNEDKERLKRLNQDKSAIFALKKLFWNKATENPDSYDIQFLAAQKIAQCMLDDVFHDLEVIQPDTKISNSGENMV